MFHVDDNLFFGRRDDGSVRIIKYDTPPMIFPNATMPFPDADAKIDYIINPDSWCSVIASVSAKGENDGRFYLAKEFHG